MSTSQTQPSEANSTAYIYKIAPATSKPLFQVVETSNSTTSSSAQVLPPSSLDISSGFIHMSTVTQIPGTLKRFFSTDVKERNAVYLLRVPLEPLEAADVVRWESPDAKIGGPRDGEGMFPHLYFENSDDGRRRLWLKRNEVEDVIELVSEFEYTGWEEGLKRLEGWLV